MGLLNVGDHHLLYLYDVTQLFLEKKKKKSEFHKKTQAVPWNKEC